MARTNGYVYRDYRKGKSGKKRASFKRRFLLFVIDVIMFAIWLVAVAGTIISLITPHYSPERLGIVSTVVLGAPIIYMVLLCTLFYWIVRWRWSLALLCLVVVTVGSFSVGKYYQVYFKQQVPRAYPDDVIKLISYNICNVNTPQIVDTIAKHKAQIVCLQEYKSDSGEVWNGLVKYFQLRDNRKLSSTVSGNADFSCEIFTNQRIIRKGLIDSLPRFNAIWADIVCSKDTIRVINLHLKSTTITAQDIEFVEGHKYVLDSARNSKIKGIADKLVENNIYRSAQARKVAQFIEQSRPMNIVVCGDFNDIPLSYTYKTVAEGLTDAFTLAGAGYRYTFNGFFRLMAIDHILVSEKINALSYTVDHSITHSDHYPIVTRLKVNKMLD